MIKSNPILWLIIFLAVVAPSFLFGAMKVVFYIIAGLILFFIILGLIFRVKIKSMQSRMEEQMRGGGAGASQTHYSTRNTSDADDVRIFTTTQTHEKRVRKDVGDYVDFEEIKK